LIAFRSVVILIFDEVGFDEKESDGESDEGEKVHDAKLL
jgi:hypothetical protein